MSTGLGPVVARVAAIVPVALIIAFVGLLWFVGLLCGEERRKYVTHISDTALEAVRGFFGHEDKPVGTKQGRATRALPPGERK